jgi:hypothetical protein
MRRPLFRVAIGIVPLLFLVALGCTKQPPSRWEQAQESTSGQPAVSESSVEGSAFNRFFPQVDKPWDIVFKQEKTGFAQASLQKDGRELAVLSVSDTANNPDAAEKYKTATETLAEYPRADIGEMATGILVGDRYQVQIRSMDPEFGPVDREEWLTRFNLDAISRIR